MAITQISRIQIRSGNLEDLPQLAAGELGWAEDTRQLFIGNDTRRENDPEINNTEVLTKYSPIEVSGNLKIANVSNLYIGPANTNITGWILSSKGDGNLEWTDPSTLVIDNGTSISASTDNILIKSASGIVGSALLNFYTANSTLVTSNINVGNITASNIISDTKITANVVELANATSNAKILLTHAAGNLSYISIQDNSSNVIVLDSNGNITSTNLTANLANVEYANVNSLAIIKTLQITEPSNASNTGEIRLGASGSENVKINSGGITFYNTDLKLTISNSGNITGNSTTSVIDFLGNASVNAISVGNSTANANYLVTISNGSVTANLDISALGNITANGTLTANGVITGNSNLELQGLANIQSKLNVLSTANPANSADTGNTSVYVAGGAILDQDVYINSNLSVGNVVVANIVNVNSNLSVGNVVVADIVNVNSNLSVSNIVATNSTSNLFISNFVGGNLIPSTDVTYDLGSNTKRWRDLYLSGQTIKLGNMSISEDTANNTVTFKNDTSNLLSDVIAEEIVANSANIGSGNILLTTTGILTAISFVGEAGNLSNIVAANVVGQVSNALVAASVYENAQPNITSLGNLTSLTVVNNITANSFTGDAGNLSNIPAANIVGTITGNISNSNYAAYSSNVIVSNQPNITQVGTLTSLAVAGNVNITSGNLSVNNDGFFGYNALANTYYTQLAANGHINATSLTANANIVSNGLYANHLEINDGTNIITVGNGNISAATANIYANRVYAIDWIYGKLDSNSNAQPNITSLGNLISLTVVGDIVGNSDLVVANNITANNANFANSIVVNANITSANVTATLLTGTLTTANQSNITSLGNLLSLNVVGNIVANNLVSNSNVTVTNQLTANNIVANILQGTLNTASNAQPNITQVGTLTNLVVAGNIIAANANLGNLVTANYLTGTLTTANQPNITTVGTLTNLVVSGTITGNSNLDISNHITSNTLTATIITGSLATANQSNITSLGTLSNLRVNGGVNGGIDLSSGPGNVRGNILGVERIYANYLSGDGSNITNIPGSQVTGIVSNANYSLYSGIVVNNSQPNITSTGILDQLTVNGTAIFRSTANSNSNVTISSGQISLTGAVTAAGDATFGNQVIANYFIGKTNASNIASGFLPPARIDTGNTYTFGNIQGTLIGNASAANKVLDSDQPNITTVGNLTNLVVTGNITAGLLITGDGGGLSNLVGAQVQGTVANSNYSVYSSVANTVANSAQPNITLVGTLSYLNTSGNILASSITANNQITANDITALNGITGTLTTSVQTAITQVGNLGNLTIDNSLDVGVRVNAATYIGNGFGLSTINGANVSAVDYSNRANTVTVAAQPNITSLGNLLSLQVIGNIDTSSYISGDGFKLSNITAANVVGTIALSNHSEYSNIANLANQVSGSNVIGAVSQSNTALVVTNPSQSNITSVGTLTNLTVDGNIVTSNNIFANSGTIRASTLTGTLTTSIQSNITQLGNLVSLTVTGAIVGDSITANGANLTNITAANIVGTVANSVHSNTSNIANTVYDSVQSNITQVGTLTTLSVSGNVTANSFIGDGSQLSNIRGANVVGTVPLANLATSVITVFANTIVGNVNSATYSDLVTNPVQSNITQVGNLISLTVDGLITGVAGIDSIITANSSYQPNITRVGELSELTVTGLTGPANLGVIDNIRILGAQIDGQVLGANGTTGELVWKTVGSGTVSRVEVIAGTGINVVGTAITSSGNVIIENTGVTELIAGNNITLSSNSGQITVTANVQQTVASGNLGAVQFSDSNTLSSDGANFVYSTLGSTLSVRNLAVTGNTTLSNVAIISGTIRTTFEEFASSNSAISGLETVDIGTNSVHLFVNQPMTTNFILNLSNVSSTLRVNNSATVTVIVKNGTTSGYICSGVKVDGQTTSLTVNWLQGETYPVTNGYDVYTFTLFRTGSGTTADNYFVIGQRGSTTT